METPKDTIRISYSDLNSLIDLINRKIDISKHTRLSIYIEHHAKSWSKEMEKHLEELREINRKYCKKDEDGCLLRNEITITDKQGTKRTESKGEYKFDAEGEKKRDAEVKKAWEQKVNISAKPLPLNEPSIQKFLKSAKYSITELNLLAGSVIDIKKIDLASGEIPEWLLSDEERATKATGGAIGNGQAKEKSEAFASGEEGERED